MKSKKSFEVHALVFFFIVIAICDFFFLIDVYADFFRIDIDTTWFDHDKIELIAVLALTFAMLLIGIQIIRLLKRHRQIQDTVEVASGELLNIIFRHFKEWKLSPSEQDIALLIIKGMSTQEIATLRETKIGTVKSQSSSIYQKANLRGRNELAAYFVEDLLAGERMLKKTL